MQLMNFFIWNKNVSFMIYSDFCGLLKFTDFKICDVIISIPINGRYTSAYFLWILNPIRMKFGQILVCCKTNISNMFLAQCWRLETSPRSFYDFIKMTIQQDLATFNSWHLPFLIVPYATFQKNEALKCWHDWLLSNWSRLPNWKGPGT